MIYTAIYFNVTEVFETDLPSATFVATALLLGGDAPGRFGVESWAAEPLRAVKAIDGSSRWRAGDKVAEVPDWFVEKFGALGAVTLVAATPELLAGRQA